VDTAADFIHILIKVEECPERESFGFGKAVLQCEALGVCRVPGEVTEVTALQRNDYLSGRQYNEARLQSF
jgi:hypothetical protein